MTTGDVVYSLRFPLIQIFPGPGFDLGSTTGESSVLTARLHMLYSHYDSYAVDTTLVSTLENFGTLSNVAELEYAINCEISKISSWLVSNMLVLNVAKPKLMLFFKSPKRPPKLTLTINGDIIE